MKRRDLRWLESRWAVQQLGIRDDVPGLLRPKRWTSNDLKGPLPAETVRKLEIALKSLPKRTPWPEIDEEAWWADVMNDPRARRRKSPDRPQPDGRDAHLRLDRFPAPFVTFSCDRCKRSRTLKVFDLRGTFGGDRNIYTIGRAALSCPNERDRREGWECPVRFVKADRAP
jgi:hypothetical protein